MKVKESIMILSAIILVGAFTIISATSAIDGERAPTNEGSIYIEPDQGDELTPSGYPLGNALPGDELLFNLWVGNNHSLDQKVLMELVGIEGWQISVTGSIDVPSGERRQISVVVIVPDDMGMDPKNDYSIRVEGVGNLTGDRASMVIIIRIDAEVDHEIVITPNNSKEEQIMVYPGQKTYVDIMVRNLGDIIDEMDIRIMDHQTDWEFIFKEDSEELYVTLPPSESGSLFRTRMLVEVPESASIGITRDVTIMTSSNLSAQYETGTSNDEVRLSFKVVPPSSISIYPLETLVEVEKGDTVTVGFNVIMSGITDASFSPVLRVYSGPFQQPDWEITSDLFGQTVLQPGDKRIVNLNIRPPAGVSGTFEVVFDGVSDNADVFPGKLPVIVVSGSNITFTDLVVEEARMGSDILINLRVLNNGDSSQQIVLDHQGIPPCFIPEIEPSSFVLIGGTSRQVDLTLYPKHQDIPLEFQFGINIKVPKTDESEWLLVTEETVLVVVQELPNVMVNEIDLPNRIIEEGEMIDINVTVSNPSSLDMTGLTLELYEITWGFSNVRITSSRIGIPHGEELTLTFNWTARPSASKIRATIVSPAGTEETDSSDNELIEAITVRPRSNPDPIPDGETTTDRIPASTAVGAAVGGSIILTAIALLANTDLVRYPFWSGIFPLYSKLKPEHLLSNRLRKRIYVYVQNNPGEHFRGILVNLNLTNGTLAHHLYTLEKESLIRSQRDGLYRRFYPAGYQIQEEGISLSPVQRKIMEAVESEPGLSQKEIAKKISVSNSTVNYNIKALKEKNAIEIRKKGKETHIYPKMDINS